MGLLNNNCNKLNNAIVKSLKLVYVARNYLIKQEFTRNITNFNVELQCGDIWTRWGLASSSSFYLAISSFNKSPLGPFLMTKKCKTVTMFSKNVYFENFVDNILKVVTGLPQATFKKYQNEFVTKFSLNSDFYEKYQLLKRLMMFLNFYFFILFSS